MSQCSIEDCSNKAHYKRDGVLCPMHYQRKVNPYVNGPERKFVHHGGARTTEYWSWSGMKARCYRRTNPKYMNYGNRGITVCDQWIGKYGFQTFLKDMGKRPGPGYTINRIDNDGNYEPSNCEWATANVQAINKTNSNNVPGVYFDKRYKNQWSIKLKVNKKLVAYGRYATEEEAIQARKLAEIKWIVVH